VFSFQFSERSSFILSPQILFLLHLGVENEFSMSVQLIPLGKLIWLLINVIDQSAGDEFSVNEMEKKKFDATSLAEECRDQDSNLGYYGHNVGS
jgi:hypothetical protein